MRIFAALVLAAGLFLSSAAVAAATTAPEPDEPAEADIETLRDAAPAAATEQPETEDPTEDHSPTDPPTTDPPTESPAPPEFSCTNARITVGETAVVSCTVFAGAEYELGSTTSQTGAEVSNSGPQIIYENPHTPGQDVYTVTAVLPDGQEVPGQVIFTVDPSPSPSPAPTSPSPTEPPPLRETPTTPGTGTDTPPAPTGTPTPPGTTTRGTTPPGTEAPGTSTPQTSPPATGSVPPRVSVPTPGVPSQSAGTVPLGSVFLPMPGMPELAELSLPGFGGSSPERPSAAEEDETQPESTEQADEEEGTLAETGTAATYTAAGLALLSIAAGALALRSSRRIA